MPIFLVFIDFDLRQKLILLVHLLFLISFMCFIGFQHQAIKNALDYVYFLTSMSLLSTLEDLHIFISTFIMFLFTIMQFLYTAAVMKYAELANLLCSQLILTGTVPFFLDDVCQSVNPRTNIQAPGITPTADV